MVSNDSSTLHLLYTLFLLLLHQLHPGASGIRSGRLGTPVIRNFFMQLWRWKSPTICCLQAGDPGKRWCNYFWIWRHGNKGGQGQKIDGQLKESGKGMNSSFLLHVLLLLKLSVGWVMPTHIWESKLLHWFWANWKFQLEIPSQAQPEIICSHISGHPLIPSSWHIKLTIIDGKGLLPMA